MFLWIPQMSILFSVSHIQIPLSGWYLLTYCTLCTSEYQVSGLRQLLMGSFLPENGPKMSNEALFDIDQLQECMVPKSSLLDDDWWWSCAYLSVGPMKFKKSLKEQMCNKGFGYTCRIWGMGRGECPNVCKKNIR